MLNKFVRFSAAAMLLASTLVLQGCGDGEKEAAKAAEQQKAAKVANDQKALRQRQCEFIGKTATDQGQCVDKR